jgi:hypothetical protein
VPHVVTIVASCPQALAEKKRSEAISRRLATNAQAHSRRVSQFFTRRSARVVPVSSVASLGGASASTGAGVPAAAAAAAGVAGVAADGAVARGVSVSVARPMPPLPSPIITRVMNASRVIYGSQILSGSSRVLPDTPQSGGTRSPQTPTSATSLIAKAAGIAVTPQRAVGVAPLAAILAPIAKAKAAKVRRIAAVMQCSPLLPLSPYRRVLPSLSHSFPASNTH